MDQNEFFPIKPSKFGIALSVESYNDKTAENLYNDEKRIVA